MHVCLCLNQGMKVSAYTQVLLHSVIQVLVWLYMPHAAP